MINKHTVNIMFVLRPISANNIYFTMMSYIYYMQFNYISKLNLCIYPLVMLLQLSDHL